MRNLSLSEEPNMFELMVQNINIKPYAIMRGGMIWESIIIKVSSYNLEDLLNQMLEDYGEDKLIEKIKSL